MVTNEELCGDLDGMQPSRDAKWPYDQITCQPKFQREQTDFKILSRQLLCSGREVIIPRPGITDQTDLDPNYAVYARNRRFLIFRSHRGKLGTS